MRFAYEISSFPREVEGYNLISYTEGTITLFFGPVVYLNATGVLLVELAVVLYKWLLASRGRPANLYYASMDFEEEPILALNYDTVHDCFWPESVWAEATVDPVSPTEARDAAETYLKELREELERGYGVDLLIVLEAALAADAPHPGKRE